MSEPEYSLIMRKVHRDKAIKADGVFGEGCVIWYDWGLGGESQGRSGWKSMLRTVLECQALEFGLYPGGRVEYPQIFVLGR